MKMFKRLPAVLIIAAIAASACPAMVFADSDIYLTRKSVTLDVGDDISIRLKGATGKIKWSIGNANVFTYSNGKITAVGEGSSYIYATNNGKRYKCKVTVNEIREGISAEKSSLKLSAGEKNAIDIYTAGKSVRVSCSNSDVCSISCGVIVDEKFPLTIKGKNKGTAVITVYNTKDKSECYKINVTVGKAISVSSQGNSSQSSDTDESGQTKTAAERQNEYIDEVIRLVNVERESAGVSTLEKDDYLCECAAVRADEISVKFSHTRPDGTKCFTVVNKNGYKGENIALGYTTPEEVMTGWMNSPGHMENILDEKFEQIGVGYDPNTNSWVQIFLG